MTTKLSAEESKALRRLLLENFRLCGFCLFGETPRLALFQRKNEAWGYCEDCAPADAKGKHLHGVGRYLEILAGGMTRADGAGV